MHVKEEITFSDHPDCVVAYSSWCHSKALVHSQQIIRIVTSIAKCIATGDILAISIPVDSCKWVRSAACEVNSSFSIARCPSDVITTELFGMVSITTSKFNNWFTCWTTT